jgi:hypothetical protein
MEPRRHWAVGRWPWRFLHLPICPSARLVLYSPGHRIIGASNPVHPISSACIHVTGMVASSRYFHFASPELAWRPVLTAGMDSGFRASVYCPSEPMNRHENKVFENAHVILDDGVYVNCKFNNCSLEYSGGDVYVQNCQGEGCQLIWRGAAQRTVLLLQGLGLMVPSPPPPGSEPPSRVQ